MGAVFFIAGVILTISSAFIFYKWGWISLAVFAPAALIPVVIGGYEGGLSLYTLPLIAGTAGGYCFRKSLGLDFFITVSAIIFALVFTSDFYILKAVRGYDFIETGKVEIVQLLEQSRGEMEKVFDQYKTPEENRKKLRADFDTSLRMIQDSKWIQFARDMIPFTAFLYSLFVTGFSFLLMKKIFLKKQGAAVKALELFRLNDYLIFSLIAGWGIFIMLDKTQFPVITVTALNVALAGSMLYIIQALGIIKFFILKKGMPVVLLPLMIMTILILGPSVIVFAMIALIGIGTLDLWGDFRKLSPEIERNIKE
ncbi:MAG TPA: DUF2232 domain-containing protein [Spirochaetota bacterium]|nr:DUF2232 domain-containing protein [Spirochaetota bacterium]